jgi:DNA repair photolyase
MGDMKPEITIATKGTILTKSMFSNYDFCINPYVGCQFGCKYCYVRFFVKDANHEWGEFVRLRKHLENKLPKELPKAAGMRVVIGTMTDPYQPIERTYRLTRRTLEILKDSQVSKVGVFTRSPIVTEDLDLIKKLPRARIHFTITPYSREILKKIEPIAVSTKRRFETVKAIIDAGIRTHVNISPAIPILSDPYTDEFAKTMAELKVNEFHVDPMQAYGEAFEATKQALKDMPDWPKIEEMLRDDAKYQVWKNKYRDDWFTAWRTYGHKECLPVWKDHKNHVMIDMNTGQELNRRVYGDDAQ